jgi:hypothetical protein
MKTLIVLIGAFIIISCSDKRHYEIHLKENGIYELKYLVEFINDYYVDSSSINLHKFNSLFNNLGAYKISDSCIVFLCFQQHSEFLINVTKDKLKVYRKSMANAETNEWLETQNIFFTLNEYLKNNMVDSVDHVMHNYSISYQSAIWSGSNLFYRVLWNDYTESTYLYYEYIGCLPTIRKFKYEKSLKNDILPIFHYKIFNNCI